MIRLARAHFPVTVLGPGTRLVLWTQGCSLACRGCMSRDTWDPDAGTPVPLESLTAVWRDVLAAGATGLTISGGEPLEQARAVAELVDAAGAERDRLAPGADILLYTGHEPAEITERAADPAVARILAGVDALITGRYRAGLETSLIWRGSANQLLLPRTALGHRRYARYIDHRPARAPVQVRVEHDAVLLIGVPRRGMLTALERELVGRGITAGEVSWRPTAAG
ncbi:4Fe-4S single cluster domain-containing protein [Nocardiopsis sp. CC223A]|uniref:4Fe-4S single cluster domain-containing protein n=1 Tax=Nocardiopsis sp. CC223A TaxID=3044051 RepID=UPI00278C876B|nr:4Fe-4S single cluster domain-containing protein [Nocardiopsis sp. CC223A]